MNTPLYKGLGVKPHLALPRGLLHQGHNRSERCAETFRIFLLQLETFFFIPVPRSVVLAAQGSQAPGESMAQRAPALEAVSGAQRPRVGPLFT